MPRFSQQLQYMFRGVTGVFRSRARALEFAKTMTLVVPLTVFIWIVAERAQVSEAPVSFYMSVSVSKPGMSASIVDAPNGVISPVTVNVKGTKAAISKLNDELNKAIRNGSVKVPVSDNVEFGEQPESVATALNNFGIFSGLTVIEASPSTMRVRREPLKNFKVPVIMPKTFPSGEPQHVVIDPDRVEVRGPASKLDRLFPDKDSGVIAMIDPSIYGTPGAQEIAAVQLRLPGGIEDDEVIISPPKLNSVKFDVVARSQETFTIRSVPISVAKPLLLEGKIIVTPQNPNVFNVQIKGPSDQIDKFRAEPPTAQAIALLTVSEADMGRENIEGTVEIKRLPPGVTVDGEPPKVRYSVRDANSPQ